MKFTFAHNNLNVYDLGKSLDFYKEALGLEVVRTKDALTEVSSLYTWETAQRPISWS